jgi:hypothetical protein
VPHAGQNRGGSRAGRGERRKPCRGASGGGADVVTAVSSLSAVTAVSAVSSPVPVQNVFTQHQSRDPVERPHLCHVHKRRSERVQAQPFRAGALAHEENKTRELHDELIPINENVSLAWAEV